MKFGRRIKTSLYPEWQAFYLDYQGLKKFLKQHCTQGPWTDQAEEAFVQHLESELEKIWDFQEGKVQELVERIASSSAAVRELVDTAPTPEGSRPASPHPEDTDDEDEAEQGRSATAGLDADELEERFRELEEELAVLVADVHDLALYTKLNYTGFIKIVKKHDKQTGYTLKHDFVANYLDTRPFYKENYDALIVKLSRLYDLVRTRGHPIQGDSAAGGTQSAFVRQTTKYWVHEENIVPLKLFILKHLPVLVFNAEKEYEPSDSAISSIYYDNEDLELYLGRLEKTEGAEAIRLRWYGDMGVKQIFVERKTHREDWTGEKSVKARFPIKEENVNPFMKGDYTMDETFEALRKKGKKSDKEIDSMIQLAKEVQYTVLTKRLEPAVRSFYNRTAFQLPGDARVRISLDTELTLVREDNWDGRRRSGDNWRRMDIGIDYPFEQLPKEDVERFPYAILEVKLQTQMGQEPPEWVKTLVNSHLVEAVPKFSKFIHGCATLMPNRVDLVPFWLPQMETDIRKPMTPAMQIERPQPSVSTASTSPEESSKATSPPSTPPSTYREPVSEGEEDEDQMREIATNESALRLPPSLAQAASEAKAFREENLKKEAERRQREGEGQKQQEQERPEPSTSAGAGAHAEEIDQEDEEPADERTSLLRGTKPSARPQTIHPLSTSTMFDSKYFSSLTPRALQKLFKAKYARERDEEEDVGEAQDEEAVGGTEGTEYVNSFRADAGKKIAVPVRVEPKVYFANERTFLKWLEFSVLVATIAVGLLNFTSVDDKTGLITAGLFTFAALFAILYSGYTFVWRALKIRKREAVSYYDRIGPSALCSVVFVAVLVNFILRFTHV